MLVLLEKWLYGIAKFILEILVTCITVQAPTYYCCSVLFHCRAYCRPTRFSGRIVFICTPYRLFLLVAIAGMYVGNYCSLILFCCMCHVQYHFYNLCIIILMFFSCECFSSRPTHIVYVTV